MLTIHHQTPVKSQLQSTQVFQSRDSHCISKAFPPFVIHVYYTGIPYKAPA